MGEIADDIINQYMDLSWDQYVSETAKPPRPKKIPKGLWMDHNGKVWKLQEMSYYHLTNTIRFLERKDNNPRKLKELNDELERRATQRPFPA